MYSVWSSGTYSEANFDDAEESDEVTEIARSWDRYTGKKISVVFEAMGVLLIRGGVPTVGDPCILGFLAASSE